MTGRRADGPTGRAFVLLLLTAHSSLLAAQSDPRIDSVFSQWTRTDGPGCIAGARQHGNTLHLKAYGMANLEYGVPLTTESISESGSVAKQFTSAVMVLLAKQGKLSLDDDIRKHLPEVPNFGPTITIRNLLTHTSGLRDQWALLGLTGWPPGTQVHSIPLILDLVSRQRALNFEPGSLYLYSNTGYALAAAIVQRVTGKSLAEWSQDSLFVPLGMNDTEWRDDYRRVVKGRATAYSPVRNGAWQQDMPFTMVYGNGGLLSTIPDLLKWNDALTAGTAPLTRDVVKQLETPRPLTDGSKSNYALGLTIDTYRGVREISHGGATAGYRTFLARWPDKDLSVAVWCNAGSADAGGYAHQMARIILGLPAEESPPAPVVAVGAGDVAPLAGMWRDSTNDRILNVRADGADLSVSAGGPMRKLTSLGSGKFWNALTGPLDFEGKGSSVHLVERNNGVHRYNRMDPADTTGVTLENYVGRYRSEELLVTFALSVKDGRLVLRPPLDPALTLRPIYHDGFSAQGNPSTVRFMRDASGHVTGLRIFAGRALDVRFRKIDNGEAP
ncbi:MAG TPA: serine hydrolase domain-containing protein [Gemmatimonadales bacterium]|nr:serine hydrolase domain-containing protein [Gemmatimonadales bacterium]